MAVGQNACDQPFHDGRAARLPALSMQPPTLFERVDRCFGPPKLREQNAQAHPSRRMLVAVGELPQGVARLPPTTLANQRTAAVRQQVRGRTGVHSTAVPALGESATTRGDPTGHGFMASKFLTGSQKGEHTSR